MTSANHRFSGRTVVVTGASQGLGRTLALTFADAEAKVALVARSKKKLDDVMREIADRGGIAQTFPTDLEDADAVEALSDAVADRLGPVNVLINNAGIPGPTAVLWKQSLDDWEQTLRINLTGVFLCCRAFLPAMLAQRNGSVIVIGSMTGKRPLYGRTPYAATKTALIGLVRTLAWEVGEAGVRVNLISPGPLAGDRLEAVLARQAEVRSESVEVVRQEMAEASPLKRFVSTAEVAAAALFLASDEATAITGEDLNVSTGIVTFG